MVEVKTKSELQAAMKSNVSEIIVRDEALLKHLRTIRTVKRFGPLAVGVVVAAVGAAVPTGGMSVVGLTAAAAVVPGVGVSALTTLCLTLGATLVIALFTDWEEIELPGGIKLKRKQKK